MIYNIKGFSQVNKEANWELYSDKGFMDYIEQPNNGIGIHSQKSTKLVGI